MRCLTSHGISWHFCTKVVSLESCLIKQFQWIKSEEKLMMTKYITGPSSPFFLHQFFICKWFPLRRLSKGPKLFGQVGWWETLGVDPWETRQPASDRADRCRRNIQETPGNDYDRYFLRLGSKPCPALYAWKSISLHIWICEAKPEVPPENGISSFLMRIVTANQWLLRYCDRYTYTWRIDIKDEFGAFFWVCPLGTARVWGLLTIFHLRVRRTICSQNFSPKVAKIPSSFQKIRRDWRPQNPLVN